MFKPGRLDALGKAFCWVALAVLTSCGGLPRTTVKPTYVSEERIEKLRGTLEEEWVRWGSKIVEVPAITGPKADVPTTSEFCMRFADAECTAVEDGCGQEQTAKLCPVVNEYWLALPDKKPLHSCKKLDLCNAKWPIEAGKPPDTPAWSAAFISAMFKKGNFSESEFRPASGHASYIAAARDNFASAYEVVPTPAIAKVGDLVCAPRDDAVRTIFPNTLNLIVGGGSPTRMHCDVVVAVRKEYIEAIGGNVQQSVSKSLIQLDSEGRVAYGLNSHRPWVLLMRIRKGAS